MGYELALFVDGTVMTGSQAREDGVMEVWDPYQRGLGRQVGAGMNGYVPPDRLATRSWADISRRAGRVEKPVLLVNAVSRGILSDPDELRLALEDTWTSNEWPGRAATNDLWLVLFEAALEPGTYLEESEARPIEGLPESVHVFRAAAVGYEDGLSWTTEFEQAHWFATRLDSLARRDHRIFEMHAPRESVLARFNQSRGENEYVIDTTKTPDEIRREVLPDEWEDRLAGRELPISSDRLSGSPEYGPALTRGEKTEPAARAGASAGVSQAEAVGLVLRDVQGPDAAGVLTALEAVDDLYHGEHDGARASLEDVEQIIARARAHGDDG